MTNPTELLEGELREIFAEDAAGTPVAGALVAEVRRRVRRRRWVIGGSGVAAAATLGVALVAAALGASTPDGVPSAAGPERHGALAGDEGASCVEAYTPSAVATRAFAFDGTVTAIGPGTTDRADAVLGLVAVTFEVHEWFGGGTGETVTVDMFPPGPDQPDQASESAPSYGVGTRLLVSGEPRWGGEPLQDAIAWTCGFTRYYDETTAADWRAAVATG